jgi:ankyrin repeat protein
VGNTGAVTLLLESGANPSVTNKFDETPLHMAVRNGKLPAVKALVEAGASLAPKTNGGDNAMSLAKKYRMAKVEEYLATLPAPTDEATLPVRKVGAAMF